MNRSLAARISIEPLDVDRDLALVHAWVTHPRSRYWMMQGWSVDKVRADLVATVEHPHHDAWLGYLDGRATFLMETYDPAYADGLGDLPELQPGDGAMHVLVSPPIGPVLPGLTTAIFDALMAFCFADPSVRRIIVEPDVANHAIRAKNRAAGFTELREISLTGKTAMLSVCSREAWEPPELERPMRAMVDDLVAVGRGSERIHQQPNAVEHLNPETMGRAQRHLVAKALAEFAHERMIAPEPVCGYEGKWQVGAGDSAYTFTARMNRLEHWAVNAESIQRSVDGVDVGLDIQELIVELAPALGIPDSLLPTYLEEIASTLAAAAWKLTHHTVPVADLVDADYQQIESAMTEGHPAFVANNGRIGFGLDDYMAYAPEAGVAVGLHWVAARRTLSTLSLAASETEEALYDGELSPSVRERFAARLRSLDLNPSDYLYLPLHPWQWHNKLTITFAPDLARRDLVDLGPGGDDYRAQQSIRTFFNHSRPERYYVKTALAIQNMGFVRGLSPAYMETTPAINDWVAGLVDADAELHACGFHVLREVAAIGYTGDAFHRLVAPSAYRKMIAALWRESPIPRMEPDEQLTTMAALLHRDAQGDALVTAWIKASPLDAAGWVGAWLRVYLRPLVHCLHAYDLAFMPHGENVLLRLREHVPVGAFMKDIGEEVAVMGSLTLPSAVERIRGEFTDDVKALAVHTDVFDGVLRFVAAILDEDGMLDEGEFWALVRATIAEHGAEHPDLADAADDGLGQLGDEAVA
ncbi:MAG: GNAT family N-acetyltransferase, partial [Nocardioidaceae bacterium]|nr:GNAT family N-acetyltransferase [Nocardioidaceae bacterium]